MAERLERELPVMVCRAVGSAVRELGNDTSSLLHHIYRTLPMLRAAPGEVLDFSTVVADSQEPPFEEAPENQQPPMTEEARSERQAAVERARARVRQALARKLRARAESVKPDPPRYDELFAEIQEWLDGLAGEPIEPLAGNRSSYGIFGNAATRSFSGIASPPAANPFSDSINSNPSDAITKPMSTHPIGFPPRVSKYLTNG